MYDFKKIEKKWQERWEKQDVNKAKDFDKKPKKYILVEFPYPSGDGLHVGHCRSYTALDIVARKSRMEEFNVLYPMGWDAFGLPTENYAIKTGRHPADVTRENTDNFRRQMKSLGYSFDWSREINTTDPEYYKWTQWIFLKFFKAGLAYKMKMPINWCPSCKIGLANEEVIDGKCERCGMVAEKKEMEQWMLRITAYADKLLAGLDEVDYPERVKEQQRNWIGKSEGAEINFKVVKTSESPRTHKTKEKLEIKYKELDIPVFTTRLDTVFGVTAIVLAPEHPLVPCLVAPEYEKDVFKYIAKVKKRTEIDRTSEDSEKTGVPLGVAAVNPFTGQEVPVWIADYVLSGYGTGAVMMVPAHDARDFAFAKKYGLDIREVVAPVEIDEGIKMMQAAYTNDGILINSGEFNGLISADARVKLADFAEAKKFGRRQINYHLRDWVFSRQHYWGEPIPLIFCSACKKSMENSKFQIPNSKQKSKFKIQNEGERMNPGWVAVPDDELPIKLPEVKKYEPSGTGESPLASISDWVNTKCPKCGGPARRETDTMPNWAGSSWYYLAYLMKTKIPPNLPFPKGGDAPIFPPFEKGGEGGFEWNKKAMKYWLPIDIYNGGMEHTTLHLLYSRFWNRFLYDQNLVPFAEPYKKRTSHGMVLGEGGIKMSKSRGNVINPDKVVAEHGADTLRVYEMFMGPFSEAIPWDTKGVVGSQRFLERVYNLFIKIPISKSQIPNKSQISNSKIQKLLHKTIKGVTEDIDNFKFNTAISKLMIFANEINNNPSLWKREVGRDLLKILAPFAPHLAEELWLKYSPSGVEGQSIFKEPWPKYDPELAKDDEFELVIQVNGKVRDKIKVPAGITEAEAKKLALDSDKIKSYTKGKEIRKIIFTGKLLNIVV